MAYNKGMSMRSTAAASGWSRRFKQQPRLWALTCAFAVAAVLLIVWSIAKAVFHTEGPYAWYAFVGGVGGFVATAIGAAVALALRQISAKVQDVMLGFAGGMMLAASTFSLI